MTEMTPDLYKAILSMDSYNRGYGAAIKLGNATGTTADKSIGIQIGNAIVKAEGNTETNKAEGFYAIAYNLNGETIISYRGTFFIWR